MKKFIGKTALSLGLVLGLSLGIFGQNTAYAETYSSDTPWEVSFTQNNKMVSNFKTSDMDDILSGLQPGDTAKFTISLENENNSTTNWYMTNKVLYSLEDRSKDEATAGGGYTYKLVYYDQSDKENVLFDSTTVGGEVVSVAGEGLHEATSALQDYFMLDTLKKGQGGRIDLTVALDGETQGNDYQDTLADLQMNFAVELNDEPTPTTTGTTPNTDNTTTTKPPSTTPTNRTTTIVRTGDDTNMVPYFIIAGVSGILLLLLGIYGVKSRKKEKGGSKA